jgi:glycosyltransferase involved in cell wall biosynthesis
MKKIIIISPFYNEESNVELFFKTLEETISHLNDKYYFELIAINDGSKDNTVTKLLNLSSTRIKIKVIDLSRNFGKEAALTAGIDQAEGDAVIPIDSDLQHPPELIHRLIDKWEEGYDVVLAKRKKRNTDSLIYRKLSHLFYSFIDRASDIKIPKDVGDFRLMDQRVINSVKSLSESRRFMKGIFAWVGFKTTTISYEVQPRHAGKSSFNLWKSWNFALEGITSFSTAPLRIWTYVGTIVSSASFFYALYIIIKTIFFGVETPGFSSIMTAILFFGGLNLVGIGIIGEYVGRTYIESKRRPSYIIREVYDKNTNHNQ